MILGVTGSVGTGKTTVSRMFARKGAFRIDADRLAREALRKGAPPYRAVVRAFGRGILRFDRSVDRKKLAEIVFRNERKRKLLNRLIHPYVIRRIREAIRRKKGKWIVVEVPLLHEAGLVRLFDRVMTVSTSRNVQETRWRKRGLPLGALRERRSSQWPLSYKRRHSDFIIDNSGSKTKTEEQVHRIWKKLHLERRGKTKNG